MVWIVMTGSREAAGTLWVEARDVVTQLPVHRIAPTTNHPAPNVSGAEVKKP